jgi:glycosyltransferase involved in cell wall biosynthesis
MKTILITAYAINPLKGSEDGMGWNYITQAAKTNRIIAVTRRNNRPDIEAFITTTKQKYPAYQNITFLYFDWPKWLLFWKKGPLVSMIYYYLWQLSLALWLRKKKIDYDVAHNLNFHNDWTPSFLWLLPKPFVWGPVGHHPRIPVTFLRPYGKKEILKDRMLWALKWMFWNLDPMLRICRKKATNIWCMHDGSRIRLNLTKGYFLHPSIAADATEKPHTAPETFTVLSVGRFVPLKGFDITVKAFAEFYWNAPANLRPTLKLMLVGKGPYEQYIRNLLSENGIEHATTIIPWMPQRELADVYQRSSVFLFPSHEGAGMVVAEAMSNGLPVLCWNNYGPGYIVHQNSDLKVPYQSYERSVTCFAEKLHSLSTNREYYNNEQKLAVDRFATSLDWNMKSHQLKAFYSKALNIKAA